MKRATGILALAAVLGVGICRVGAKGGLPIQSGDNYQVIAGKLAGKSRPLRGRLYLEIKTLGEWKFAEKAPILIDIQPPPGLVLTKLRLTKTDSVGAKVTRRRFEVPYQAMAKGSYELKLKFDFVICTKTLCQKKRFETSYQLSLG